MTINRVEASRALAKCIAYLAVGNKVEARAWFRTLAAELGMVGDGAMIKDRLLAPRYKTWQGADKRARFENAVAPGEYARGDKAKLYRYSVEKQNDRCYRVRRWRPE